MFFFKQKTAYEMRISDWSSDVCSSDLRSGPGPDLPEHPLVQRAHEILRQHVPPPAATCPGSALVDVRLLCLVEVGPGGDPGLEQPVAFFRLEGCGVVGLVEQVAHGSSQRSRSRSACSVYARTRSSRSPSRTAWSSRAIECDTRARSRSATFRARASTVAAREAFGTSAYTSVQSSASAARRRVFSWIVPRVSDRSSSATLCGVIPNRLPS